MADALLQTERLTRRFGGVTAADAIGLMIAPKEVHAIIGPNGAGKTTLIGLLSGEIVPEEGSIRFDGTEISGLPVYRRSQLGLARSFQITSLFRDFTALDNVALAVQAHRGHSFRFWRDARREDALRGPAFAALERVGLRDRAGTRVDKLSHGEQRQLEIAMALASDPQLLLLDEPMAGMGPDESARMVHLLRALKGSVTILLIEHDMEAVFALADRLSVLVYGRIIASGDPGDHPDRSGRAAGLSGRKTWHRAERARWLTPRCLNLPISRRATAKAGCCSVLRSRIAPGEMVSLMGRNGMGKTTTVRSIMGLTPAAAGNIRFNGVQIHGLPAYRIAKLGLGLVPEGRQVFPNLTARENLLATAANRTGVSDPWTLAKVFTLFPRLAERASSMANLLSGGEQQMLAIGRALMTNPRLIILDEATEGLAPLIREEIWRCLELLRKSGQSILVIDKNVDALTRIADRHYIIERGRVVWSGNSQALAGSPDVQHRYLGI